MKWSTITFVLIFTLVGDTDCGKDDEKKFSISRAGRFKDIAQATNFLKENLPANITFEEQCERYAVLSDISLSVKFPFKEKVLDIAKMDLDALNEQYEKLNIERISYAYMSVIDRYRITKLAPPMMDLIECLKKIDTHVVRTYLGKPELGLILHLYKQVLEQGDQQDKQISIESLHRVRLRPAFQDSLRNLFAEYFDVDEVIGANSGGPNSIPKPIDPSNTDESIEPQSSGLQKLQDQEIRREHSLKRRRDMARLKQQRMRMLYPELREKNRLYQEERREFFRYQQRLWSMRSPLDESESERLEREARDRRNERRRRRYRSRRGEQRLPKLTKANPLQSDTQEIPSQLLQESQPPVTPVASTEQMATQSVPSPDNQGH